MTVEKAGSSPRELAAKLAEKCDRETGFNDINITKGLARKVIAALESTNSTTTDALERLEETVQHQITICTAADSMAYVNDLNWFIELIHEERKKS